jgi:hypothetical protein
MMNEQFTHPKVFSEILDHTFKLCKNNFKQFAIILLILVGPIYLLQAAIQLFAGTSFFRAVGGDGAWYEQIITSFEQTSTAEINWVNEIGIIGTDLLSMVLFIVAEAAILFAINHIRKNEEYTVRSVLKQGFSRFWPLFWSSILFGLIVIGLVIVPILLISLAGILGAVVNPIIGIILGVLLFLGSGVGVAYLLTRWSFYFASVVFKEGTPGFTRSWRLSTKRTWALIGLYIVFSLITASISMAVEFTAVALLGNSVLYTMLINVVTLFTTMIFSVGFAVMYFDLKIRHDADDLKEMIASYDEV